MGLVEIVRRARQMFLKCFLYLVNTFAIYFRHILIDRICRKIFIVFVIFLPLFVNHFFTYSLSSFLDFTIIVYFTISFDFLSLVCQIFAIFQFENFKIFRKLSIFDHYLDFWKLFLFLTTI